MNFEISHRPSKSDEDLLHNPAVDIPIEERGDTGMTANELAITSNEEEELEEMTEVDLSAESEANAEDLMERYLRLKIPTDYHVKFDFTPEKVMIRLSKDRLRRLQKVWEQNEDGLNLFEFMKLMVLEVPSIKAEKLEMIHGLIRLFKQVDVNGDQQMEWSEFVQYIIDQVLSESIVATHDVKGNITSIGDIIKMQEAGEFTKLKRSGFPVDKGRHRKPMQDVLMCEDARKKENTLVMHSEENSTTIQWYQLDMKVAFTEQVPVHGQTDRVLSIAYQDLSKSFYSFGPQGTDAVYAVLCTDHILYLYIRIRGRIELFSKMETGPVMQSKVWFLPQHKTWLTAGKDFKIRQWNVSPLAKTHLMEEPVQLHSDLITDCVEIINPFCIATASLDRSIVLYDLKKKEVLRRFTKKHVTGVRCLRYMKDFGGMIISTGFEIFANVWGPQNLFGNAHLGRLRGHRKPIVGVDIIQGRPFVFTLDQANEMIIWDIRSIQALQTIPPPGKNEKLCHGILAISPDLVWIYGYRFITYDPQEIWQEDIGEHDELSDKFAPINAYHNQFFGTIFVQTAQDLKIYSCLDGNLMVMHQSVFKHPKINCVSIRQDKRHRKAYIASSDGQIEVINIQSGVSLKSIFEGEDQQYELEASHRRVQEQMEEAKKARKEKMASPGRKKSKQSPSSSRPITQQMLATEGFDTSANGSGAFITGVDVNEQTAATNLAKGSPPVTAGSDADGYEVTPLQTGMPLKREIVDMILVWEDKMNQLIYADRAGYFVYAEEDDSSQMLRRVTGAHIHSITAIQFSYHLSLIATGTESGEVGVWDYELSQLLGICQGHNKGSGEITAIEFMQPFPVMATAAMDGKVILWAVRPAPQEMCYVSIGVFCNVSFNGNDDNRMPVRGMVCHAGESLKGISRGRNLKHSQIPADTYRDFKTNQVLATKDGTVKIDKNGNYRGLSQMKEMRLQLLKEALQTDDMGRTKIEVEFEKMRIDYLDRMENLDPSYDETVDEEKLRVMLYLGDDAGILKLWDLTYIIEKAGLQPCIPIWEQRGDQYFPNRSERVNVSGYAMRLRDTAAEHRKRQMSARDPEDSGLIIRETAGHRKEITKLNQHNFNGLISVGNDCMVRIWSHGLDLWGVVDCRNYESDPNWYFPTKDKKESELKDIAQMQLVADQLRQDDEQAVIIQRNDDEDEEQFDSMGIYKKYQKQVSDKKRAVQEAEEAEQHAMNEEKREWNLAMAKAKERPMIPVKKKKKKDADSHMTDRDKRVIERVEELLAKERKVYEDIQREDDPITAEDSKGQVIARTESQLDKLIRQAMNKHQRKRAVGDDDSSSSPNRRRISRKGHYSKSPMTKRSQHASDSDSVISGSPSKRPSPRKMESKVLMKGGSRVDGFSSFAKQASPMISKRNESFHDESPMKFNIQQTSPKTAIKRKTEVRVPAFSGVINPRQLDKDTTQSSQMGITSQMDGSQRPKKKLIKNNVGSNLSLELSSSVDSLSNAAADKKPDQKRIMEPISPIMELAGAEKDDDSELAQRVPVERRLEELNQTMALMKKIEATGDQANKLEKMGHQPEYVQDTKDDRSHLLRFKNLPSIRDRLFSIKSKQQMAVLDPKYNIVNRTPQQNMPTVFSKYHSRKQPPSTTASKNQDDQSLVTYPHLSRRSLEPEKRYATFGQKKSHQQLMNELAVIAKDLEIYNANRIPKMEHFASRARSMVVPRPEAIPEHLYQSMIPGTRGDQSTASYNPNDVHLQNIQDIAITVANENESQLSSIHNAAAEQDAYRLQSSLLPHTLSKDESLASEKMAEHLKAFRSQIYDGKQAQAQSTPKRNLILARTPQDYRRQLSRLKNDGSIERLQKNASVQRIPNILSNSDLRNYEVGSQEMQGPSPLMANHAYGHINLEISQTNSPSNIASALLDIGINKNSRNQPKQQFLTEENSAQILQKDGLPSIQNQSSANLEISSKDNSALINKQLHKKGQHLTAEDRTAAMSGSNDVTLEHDASRQYLDYNINIDESSIEKAAYGRRQQQSQILPHNLSLSHVSASHAHFSEAPADHEIYVGAGLNPMSLYGANIQNKQTRGKSLITKLSQSATQGKEAGNWKARRRQSEQTRLNEETGKLENIDLLMEKKNTYLALKRKYAGKDSDMAQLMRREAENIQKQRARINELKDFKSMMKNLKKTAGDGQSRGVIASGLSSILQQNNI